MNERVSATTHLDEGGESDRDGAVGDGSVRQVTPGEDEDGDAEGNGDGRTNGDPDQVLRDAIFGALEGGHCHKRRPVLLELLQDDPRLPSLVALDREGDLCETAELVAVAGVKRLKNVRGRTASEGDRQGEVVR